MEWRRHPRVREEIPVRWAISQKGMQGQGIVRNVSISGLLLEVDEHFTPVENAQFIVEIADDKIPRFIPLNAKMVWFSPFQADRRRKFCGLKFEDPTGPVFSRLKEHIETRLSVLEQATDINIINRYLYQSN